jgi:hypothetical protein
MVIDNSIDFDQLVFLQNDVPHANYGLGFSAGKYHHTLFYLYSLYFCTANGQLNTPDLQIINPFASSTSGGSVDLSNGEFSV